MAKKKILIMGLPGSGKTSLAKRLYPYLKAVFLNNDEVRKKLMIGTLVLKGEKDRLKE